MPRELMELSGPLWRFQPDVPNKGELLGWHLPEHDDSAWLAAMVPGTAEDCSPWLRNFLDSSWFRRWFDAPAHWAEKRVVIRFESVTDHCEVYLNGRKIGAHADGYLRFDLEAGAALKPGQRNLLAVRVDNQRWPQDCPGLERGWRTYSGIMREVYAIAMDKLYLANVGVVAEPCAEGGKLRVVATVINSHNENVSASLAVSVLETGFRSRTLTRGDFKAGDTRELIFEGIVEGAEAWTPESPRLYTVRVQLINVWPQKYQGDAQDLRVGFRKVETREGQIFLNGRRVFLTGFNRHEDSPTKGLCTDLETARADLVAMKQNGANFVRLCHYPHHPGELDLCDELGLLVMCEIPVYWWRGYEHGEEQHKAKRANAKRQLRNMILRDRNHPSVIFWSVSNETVESRPEVVEGNDQLMQLARELDPTRFVTHVSCCWWHEFNFAVDDVICVNGYPAHHLDRWQNLPSDQNVMNTQPRLPEPHWPTVTQWWRQRLAAVHEKFPGKAIVVTEFGHPAIKGVAEGHYGEDRQTKVIEADTAGMDAPYVAGMTIWCWADHTWHESSSDNLSFSPYGVVTRDRRPKASLATVKRIFSERQRQARPAMSAAPGSP